jgi:hypothetical protein
VDRHHPTPRGRHSSSRGGLALPLAHRAHARLGPYFTLVLAIAALCNIIMLLRHLRIGPISDLRMHITKTSWWPM